MTENNITRRKALKAIIATTGGVGASAFFPSKWLKPVVQSGVLPVHAQGSGVVGCTKWTGYITNPIILQGTDFIPFDSGNTTPADDSSYCYTTLTIAWTGGFTAPDPQNPISVRFMKDEYTHAGGEMLELRTTPLTCLDAESWTTNRPYAGLFIQSPSNNPGVTKITVTLK